SHDHVDEAGGDEDPATRIDAEGADVKGLRVGMLDGRRLAGARVDGEYRDVVLATAEDALAVELHRGIGPIGDVDGATVRMHVDAPGGLRKIDGVGADGGARVVGRLRSQTVALEAGHVQLVLGFHRDVNPPLGRV